MDSCPVFNAGYARWCQLRKEWTTGTDAKLVLDKTLRRYVHEYHLCSDAKLMCMMFARPKEVDTNAIVEGVLSPARRGALPDTIPLPQMIDILTELWEADGLFD
jgi:hypothetical protein